LKRKYGICNGEDIFPLIVGGYNNNFLQMQWMLIQLKYKKIAAAVS
jgi:hypothetical protein